ncbi:hypothetical protein ARALYDRAFT_339268 [Arabidopsis lyrata subsp. lyrata]|uniref:F-box domain-containing protein n=1 Tax=Arabidopsis lyrata subsp. lyrata TaxID=81972 RepID=D7KY16_ARALL|nr:hypothetical protein ARALYDRAFT_339268 [Arabidopsis lyrata subsp. lyrata]
MVNTSFETPPEMHVEILARLPLKSLMKFMSVSKKWESIIRGEQFRRDYLIQSMTRPRVLFVANRRYFHNFKPEALFHSVYQEEPSSLSSVQQMRTYETPLYKVSQPVRGLICHQGDTNIVICNPGLKKFRNLPQIEVPEFASMRSFFGYDEVKNVFKVLCITQLVKYQTTTEGDIHKVRSDVGHQVYTVRSDVESSSWKGIACNYDYSAVTEGLFKGGFLYYGAQSNNDQSVVMSFNVSSEDFSVIELPNEVDFDNNWKLVNYKGGIALVDEDNFDIHLNGNRVFKILFRNEVAGNWEIETIEIPRWKETVDNEDYHFKGTIGTGELLVFAPTHGTRFGRRVLYCDEATKNLRRFDIEERMIDEDHIVRTFFDHANLEDIGMDMADLKTLNYDDLDNFSKLQKSQRYADIIQKVEEALEKGTVLEYKKLIEDCNQLLVDIENEIVIVHNFIREKYRLKFQELESLVHHPIDYVRVVKRIGNEMDLTLVDLEGLLPSAMIMVVSVTASTTKGNQLPKDVLLKTIDACNRALDLDSARKKPSHASETPSSSASGSKSVENIKPIIPHDLHMT